MLAVSYLFAERSSPGRLVRRSPSFWSAKRSRGRSVSAIGTDVLLHVLMALRRRDLSEPVAECCAQISSLASLFGDDRVAMRTTLRGSVDSLPRSTAPPK